MKNIPIRHINSAQKEPSLPGNFSIREVREVLEGKAMIQELHRHDFFFILALEKGRGSHEIDFTPHRIKSNSIFFMRPGQVHQLTLKAGSTGYLMQFNTEFYHSNDKASRDLLRRASNKNHCQLDGKIVKKFLEILSSISREYSDMKEGYQEVIKASLEIFFIELVRNRKNSKSLSGKVNSYEQERFEEFMELVETHFATHKQVSDYAGMLNLSTYQLNAITKAAVGKRSSELINEYIILESKRYLLATSNLVNQVAYHLGYEDVSYFIRFFKKHTGYSPESFRHNFR